MIDRRTAATALIIVCLLVYVVSLYGLWRSYDDIAAAYSGGATPVLVLSPQGEPIGTVVVAHGFAANIGVMRALGADLARNGYRAVLFDFPGYGNSRLPMNETSMQVALDDVCARYGGEGYSLAGHSMGSLAVLLYGNNGSGRAVVGISSFYANASRELPRNMLLVAGAGDLPNVVSSLPQAVANGTGLPDPAPGTTYGSAAGGTARKYLYVDGNHITVLYNAEAYDEIVRWLDATYRYNRTPGALRHDLPFTWAFAAIGAALAAFLPGLYLLAGYARDMEPGPGPFAPGSWARPLLVIAAASLIAVAAAMAFNPASLLEIVMADQVIGLLFYSGAFALIILGLMGQPGPWKYGALPALKALCIALAATVLLVVAIAIPAGLSFYEQPSTPGRLLLMAAAALMALPFFVACDLLSIRAGALRSVATGIACRAIVLAFLALSFAASNGGFFNIVILPIVAVLFLSLEVVSYCAYRWTGNTLAGAFINALITGWLLASAFPAGPVSFH